MPSGFAPAKINLALHVTGQRADGYHLLDSLVAFADVGDRITARPADTLSLTLSGPFAAGVPTDDRNLMIRAARALHPTAGAALHLEKNLPHPAGIGGGSSDAATTLRLLSDLWGLPLPDVATLAKLGADVPVCISHIPQYLRGIGDDLSPAPALPPLHLILVNPGIDMPTPSVFKSLTKKDNFPMQPQPDAANFLPWLAAQRNDLEPAACALAPEIRNVLNALSALPDCKLARMSGSGATCFGLFTDPATDAATALSSAHPNWWVRAAPLLS